MVTFVQFEAGISARKFRGYQCTGRHAALDEKTHQVEPQTSHDEGAASPSESKQQNVTETKL